MGARHTRRQLAALTAPWLLLLPRVPCCRYQSIVAAHPGNVEALRYLVTLCQQSGREADAQRYGHLLRRAEVSRHAGAGFATAENAPALCESNLVAHADLGANLTIPCLQLPAGTHYRDAGDRGGSCSSSGRASAAPCRRPAAAVRHWL